MSLAPEMGLIMKSIRFMSAKVQHYAEFAYLYIMAFKTEDIVFDGKPVYCFRDRDILLHGDGTPAGVDCLPALSVSSALEDTLSGLCAVELSSDTSVPEGCRFIPLRHYFASNLDSESARAARMRACLNWMEGMHFCPSCGTGLTAHGIESALRCPSCGKVYYPRISPCVITVITKGDEILLLRHRQRNQDIWCCLAGFVEAGESLEQALAREIMEETGLEVDNIRYAGSQSWPFPDQLMLAFYAVYKKGELKVQEDEIIEARWFKRTELPAHPSRGSISWRLIHFDF